MTEKEARITIENAGLDWWDFDLWMAGQTVGMGDNGEIEYYPYDVLRFIRYGGSKGEPVEAWD